MTTFVFICQTGLIECQSLLLAMSLRRFTECEIVAAWPRQFGDLHPFTLSILKKLDVHITEIKNDFLPVYPCGNKIFAADVTTKSNRTVLLDSDIICVRTPCGELDSHPIIAIETGRFDVITHKEWKLCHRSVGLDMPVRFRHVRSPIVSFEKHTMLPKKWLEIAKVIYQLPIRKIRQTDQISLALTSQIMTEFYVHNWIDNPLMLSPSEIYNFNELTPKKMPIFLVLQKGWLYYERQGYPKIRSSNPNSLAYYDDIRSLIYSLISEHPSIDRIPGWDILHALYFSQQPLDRKKMNEYIQGVERGQK